MLRRSTYRRRWLPFLLGAAGILGSVGVVAAVYVVLLAQGHSTRSPPPVSVSASPTKPACPTARLTDAARLGDVAWIEAGTLRVIDLPTCRQTVLLSSGAAPPVRFSPDGQWLAFGDGRVVPVAGGSVQQPFGSPVTAWTWSPTADLLAGVTQEGGVLIARPGSGPETLLPGGSGA